LLKRKEEERLDPCSFFLQFFLLFIDFEHIFERFRTKRSKKTRRVSLHASSQMTLSLFVSKISLILIEAPMVVV
jgi:hypothetical protein